jgi:hypothetical protein
MTNPARYFLLAASLAGASALSATAFAGPTGSGPAGTGSTTVGSAIGTQSSSSAIFGTPGTAGGRRLGSGAAGVTQLTPAETARISAKLYAAAGAIVHGPFIQAPTTLANGKPGVVVLDTRANTLTIVQMR